MIDILRDSSPIPLVDNILTKGMPELTARFSEGLQSWIPETTGAFENNPATISSAINNDRPDILLTIPNFDPMCYSRGKLILRNMVIPSKRIPLVDLELRRNIILHPSHSANIQYLSTDQELFGCFCNIGDILEEKFAKILAYVIGRPIVKTAYTEWDDWDAMEVLARRGYKTKGVGPMYKIIEP